MIRSIFISFIFFVSYISSSSGESRIHATTDIYNTNNLSLITAKAGMFGLDPYGMTHMFDARYSVRNSDRSEIEYYSSSKRSINLDLPDGFGQYTSLRLGSSSIAIDLVGDILFYPQGYPIACFAQYTNSDHSAFILTNVSYAISHMPFPTDPNWAGFIGSHIDRERMKSIEIVYRSGRPNTMEGSCMAQDIIDQEGIVVGIAANIESPVNSGDTPHSTNQLFIGALSGTLGNQPPYSAIYQVIGITSSANGNIRPLILRNSWNMNPLICSQVPDAGRRSFFRSGTHYIYLEYSDDLTAPSIIRHIVVPGDYFNPTDYDRRGSSYTNFASYALSFDIQLDGSTMSYASEIPMTNKFTYPWNEYVRFDSTNACFIGWPHLPITMQGDSSPIAESVMFFSLRTYETTLSTNRCIENFSNDLIRIYGMFNPDVGFDHLDWNWMNDNPVQR